MSAANPGPVPPPGPDQPLTRAAAAAGRSQPSRRQPRPGPYWAGVAATAVVSALIGLLGALVARDIFDLDLRLPTWVLGGNDVWRFTILGGVSAIIAGALLELLFVATPTPTRFFSWIVGLLTAAAAILPFSQGGTTGEQGATAIIVILIGVSLLSILPGVAARTMRPI